MHSIGRTDRSYEDYGGRRIKIWSQSQQVSAEACR